MGMGMGMSVSSTATSATSTSSTANWQQRKQDMDALSQALSSGNLDQAKAAYAQVAKDNPNAANNSNSPLAQIGSALQSGDLSGAQQAFSSMKSHFGHHRGTGTPPPSSTSTTATTSTLPNPTDTMGTLVNTQA